MWNIGRHLPPLRWKNDFGSKPICRPDTPICALGRIYTWWGVEAVHSEQNYQTMRRISHEIPREAFSKSHCRSFNRMRRGLFTPFNPGASKQELQHSDCSGRGIPYAAAAPSANRVMRREWWIISKRKCRVMLARRGLRMGGAISYDIICNYASKNSINSLPKGLLSFYLPSSPFSWKRREIQWFASRLNIRQPIILHFSSEMDIYA